MHRIGENTQQATGPDRIFSLLDSVGRILWMSETFPPYAAADVIGQLAWFSLKSPHDAACQQAILLCVANNERQRTDVEAPGLGILRCWYFPAKVGRVRIACECAKVPASVQLLTPRESEICLLLSDGLNGTQIAGKLGIMRTTLDNHKKHIADKLEIQTAALTAWAGKNRQWLQ
jgi:DNA-binding NarL/FixJ family response regulator